MAVCVVVGNAVVAYWSIGRLQVNEQWLVHTYQVLDALQRLRISVNDADGAFHVFHITTDPSYQEGLDEAGKLATQQLATVRTLVEDNALQLERAEELRTHVGALMAALRHGFDIRSHEGRSPSAEYIETGAIKLALGEVLRTINAMETEENRLMALRGEESSDSFRTARVNTLLAVAFGLGLIFSAGLLGMRELQARQRASDILTRSHAQLEIRVLERTSQLNMTNEALQRSNRELEQFASVASHDLQEPLRKIQAFGDRLATRYQPVLGEQGQEYVARMQSSATRMRRLIDDLLEFSRVTTKAQPLEKCDLGQIAREVVSDLESRLQQTGGRVDIGPLPTIRSDPTQMRQLLQNLIGNALKFHRPNVAPMIDVRGRVLTSEGNGQVDSSPKPQAEVVVTDNGIGFEQQFAERIFDVFQRLHGRQEFEGTGMGLAICRRIVERHGGHIRAESQPGAGARFIVTLPIEPLTDRMGT